MLAINYERQKPCILSGHFLETLQNLSNDYSQSDPINGYEALDYLHELVESSRDSHEHESHHHGAIEDIDFKIVRNEETEHQGIFNGKGLTVSPYAYFLSFKNFNGYVVFLDIFSI